MAKQMRRILICGAVAFALALALAGGSPPPPLSASTLAASAPASLCVAPEVASADIVASQSRCARERRNERRMCRRHGLISWQCLNAWIETAKCEGRFVESHALTTSMDAVRGTGPERFLLARVGDAAE